MFHTAMQSAKRTFECKKCGKILANSSSLNAHEKRHSNEKPFSCFQCNQRFTQEVALQNHQLIKHTNEKQFICPQCGKGEATQGNLKRHQNSHRERATMPCHICQKLISSSTLKVHMKIHKDEKPYACSHCDATFKSSQALKRHTGIHTGNKTSFSCLKCEKSCQDKEHLSHI